MESNELKITGGARIGSANASFPFANLKVNKNKLEINASIVGNLVFQPSDVISIEPHSGFISNGIKINHKVDSYNEKVIFWTFKNPQSLINQIAQTGFLNNQNTITASNNETIRKQQNNGGFPLKKSFAIAAIVLWNLLFLIDMIPILKGEAEEFGYGILSALGLLFTSALLSLVSSDFRGMILKEGRTIEDIKKFAIFLMIISGMMMLNFVFISKLTY